MRYSPGCSGDGCHCDSSSCANFFSDNFNRASLGSDWTAAAGSPSISGNALQLAPGDFAICNVPSFSLDDKISLGYKAKGATTNDLLYVANTYQDTSNYNYIKQVIDTGSANGIPWLGKRVAGTNYDLDFYGYSGGGTGVGASYPGSNLTSCSEDGYLFGGGSGPGGGYKVPRLSSNTFGFYAPATNTTNVYIDEVTATGVASGCQCSNCCRGLLDRQMEAVIAGITTAGFTDLNGTYYLDYQGITDQGFGAADPVFNPNGTYGLNLYCRMGVAVSGKASGVTSLACGMPVCGSPFEFHFSAPGCNWYVGFGLSAADSFDCTDLSSPSYGPTVYAANKCSGFTYSSGCSTAINSGATLTATLV